MKATDNALDDRKDAIRLLQAGPVPLKPAPRNKWAGGSLFLDGGDHDAATEYPTLLEKQAVDDIPSTLSVSSRTKKRKLNSIPRRTHDSQASISAGWGPDPIEEDGFASISGDEPRGSFVAMLIGCHRLALPRPGILDHIVEDPYIKSFGKINLRNPTNIFKGLKLTLRKADKTNIVLFLGDIVHRQGGLIGRNTCVVSCSSPEWPGMQLVVKISWPSIHRVSEKTLMDAAKAKADEMAGEGNSHWSRLIELLIKDEYANGKTFIYEEYLLRITVSYNGPDQCHHWLYENPKILHRDMSLNNMMYRKRSKSKGKFRILGVLNDFDLSSLIPLKEAVSLHRTGAPPYMADDLLGQSDIGHLYRHDVEAFYYVLLMLCCRYEIVQSAEGKVVRELQSEQARMPFAQWYDRTVSRQGLSDSKHTFLRKYQTVPTSASFSAFRPWLQDIRYLFGEGLHALEASQSHLSRARLQSRLKQPVTTEPSVSFDNETLGGHITSEQILQIMSEIDGLSLNDQP
ncbi:hypothetical protein EDD85DRAFT_791824 [Armillaria nabsnona]|nr:hypothetical protein EDD85DRAFT_791824 [Armillaria nabsnona]